jgi:TusA-related sulfurtransferase
MRTAEKERKADREVDLSGLSCPVPIVMTSETVKRMKEGQVLKVIATDPGYERDLLNWARQTGNEIVALEREGNRTVAYIRKRSRSSEPSLLYWIKFHALGVKLHLRLFLLKLNPFSKKPDHFITFTAISEGTRAERFLRGKFGAVLLPVPDEIDPRCGVVLALRGERRALEVYNLLLEEGFGVEAVYRRKGRDYVRVYP